MVTEEMSINYDEALKRCKPSFRSKLEHSVELIRKAERIALMYDSDDGYYLAFSGGKDSQALYHVAQLAGVKFKGHMSLTSVDPPQVIRFVKKHYPDVGLIKPKMSMFDKAIEMGILPTMRVRWCCAHFKESAGDGKVTLIGIRAAESARRAKRNEVEVKSRKFSGDLEGFDAWSQAEIEKKMAKAKRKLNEDEFSLNTDNEVRCINGKDSILISPIFKWTEDDVWYFLNKVVQVPHCELYDMGYTRIGCILCPMSSYKSKLRDIQAFPHVKRGWIKAIKGLRRVGDLTNNSCGGTFHLNGPTQLLNEEIDSTQSNPARNYPPQQIRGNVQPRQFIYTPWLKFNKNWVLESHASCGVDAWQCTEDEIAEAIFDWWISGKPYKQWYADTYLQNKLEFEE